VSYDLESTIVALASPPGGAARGIVRVSGPRMVEVVAACFEPEADGGAGDRSTNWPTPRRATVIAGRAIAGNLTFPCQLWLWPTPRSYTGQPTAELHTLGSPPLLEALLAALCQAGARLAGPGEFTLRAFLAGRLDLTQAEAVLGVIDAQGPESLTAALAQLAGGLGRPLGALRGRLLDLLADLEAGLDFADEDLEFVSPARLAAELVAAADEVAAAARQLDERGSSGELPRVVLVGPPNAGKSSLFNALAGGARALVSEIAGTTRDYLAVMIECEGLRCELVDTAGHDERAVDGPDSEHLSPKRKRGWAANPIAAQAQDLAQRERRQAALLLECRDARDAGSLVLSADEQPPPALLVLTKADLLTVPPEPNPQAVLTSSSLGLGLAELRRRIGQALSSQPADSTGVASTAARCADSLRRAHQSLQQAQAIAAAGAAELAAAEVRAALDALGEVVGAIYTEDLLDRIFSRFCIGK
jgi:tRNA modification GTPase